MISRPNNAGKTRFITQRPNVATSMPPTFAVNNDQMTMANSPLAITLKIGGRGIPL
jgi:hypothetical protein